MADTSYLLDNAWRDQRARLDAIEDFLDPGTIGLLQRIGVREGWRCFELGAGGGSIAAWLGDRVGPSGHVVAADLDIRHCVARASAVHVEARRCDIVADALEEGAFDLVHARLVLEHIPQRDDVLRKLARALRPSGWLMVEAVDYASAIAISALGAAEHTRSQAVRLRVFEAAGLKADYGRQLPRLMREAGLVDLANEGRVFVMEGGSPGARWFDLSMRQVRAKLEGPDRLRPAEIDRMLELFVNPGWAAFSPIILACWGRRAASSR